MGGEDSGSALANRVDARCGYNNLDSFFARRIVSELDALLNEHNELLKIFKSHMHKLESDNHAIVINPDITPAGEHIRRFNAPVADDVAGIMVGDRTGAREIVIRRRNSNLQFIADTHRSYDALQYPLIFWKGQDGYSININEIPYQELDEQIKQTQFFTAGLSHKLTMEGNEQSNCQEIISMLNHEISLLMDKNGTDVELIASLKPHNKRLKDILDNEKLKNHQRAQEFKRELQMISKQSSEKRNECDALLSESSSKISWLDDTYLSIQDNISVRNAFFYSFIK
ncbi:helitron_like_N domain-containing protein [Nephila pilipes]|uniref:Helitron_like_N domain-containing protein n=1 Tax=Nephila pilipes TaxID=299642 RepID=A0A8X6U7N7_NEPPI|nr:helitron_like_N domain-containing protein [Nephila pilipes]